MTLRVACIVGTRPEAIKMAPLILAARNHPTLELKLIATGQHDTLFDDALTDFGITADAQLGAPTGADLSALRDCISAYLMAQRPDMVLVQGDTNSALAGAQAAHTLGIPIGHVEAGLRSHNLQHPFPEENNRVAIAQLTTLHFAPAQRAADNLAAERVNAGVYVTGNTGIDALMMIMDAGEPVAPQHILITCHRRENFGAPLLRICSAIREIAEMSLHPLILPLHPNPNVRDVMVNALGATPNVRLIAPLGYREMITMLCASAFVLSDSGGVQEECAALGVPLLLMRETTERQELVASGNVRLVGNDTALIIKEAQHLLNNPAHRAAMSVPTFPYGKGDAVAKIIAQLEEYVARA